MGLALSCAAPVAPWYEVDPGEGKLLLIREFAEKSGRRTVLEVHTRAGTLIPDIERPLRARWIDANTLLVHVRTDDSTSSNASSSRLVRYDLSSKEATALPFAERPYDLEPSPTGARLAWGREAESSRARSFEVRSLAPSFSRLGSRSRGFKDPRWRPDGQQLVASLAVGALEAQGVSSTTAPPRLHLLSPKLGEMRFLEDSDQPGRLEPGGTRPLWWDSKGIWARQDRGLVRCDPSGGCELVYRPEMDRQVAGGRPVGGGEALLLLVTKEAAALQRAPDAIHRVNLDTGEGQPAYLLEPGESFTDIDWISVAASPGD